jgi:putative peptidoglycan binding protein
MDELDLQATVRLGDRGPSVRRVQEWLSLNGLQVKVDGDFGPATQAAVREFESGHGLSSDGEVGAKLFELLTAPMRAALARIEPGGRPLGALTIAYAQQHLAQHPREIGGQNRGPWVRLYMSGHDGEEWAWCAGFACFCVRQACETLGVGMPIVASFSCDSLAASATERGRFLREPDAAGRAGIRPGHLFLNRRTPSDWTHTGLVVAAGPDSFRTVEGNTNDDGSREGYEVCARMRGYTSMDFIVM